jgi:hypothetical protein
LGGAGVNATFTLISWRCGSSLMAAFPLHFLP